MRWFQAPSLTEVWLSFPILHDQGHAHCYANTGYANRAPHKDCTCKSHRFPPIEILRAITRVGHVDSRPVRSKNHQTFIGRDVGLSRSPWRPRAWPDLARGVDSTASSHSGMPSLKISPFSRSMTGVLVMPTFGPLLPHCSTPISLPIATPVAHDGSRPPRPAMQRPASLRVTQFWLVVHNSDSLARIDRRFT
jgi:hypothetical protein